MKRKSKILWAVYVVLYVNIICMACSFAYLDPTTTTFLLQVIVGVAVAVGTVAAVLFRKAKKKVSDKLGIDEKEKKEVEEEFTEIEEEAPKSEKEQMESDKN